MRSTSSTSLLMGSSPDTLTTSKSTHSASHAYHRGRGGAGLGWCLGGVRAWWGGTRGRGAQGAGFGVWGGSGLDGGGPGGAGNEGQGLVCVCGGGGGAGHITNHS